MNRIEVKRVAVEGSRISVEFETTGEVARYFTNHVFWAEYAPEDLPSAPPVGVAVVPFVCNILPIVWLTDSELILPEIDQDFFNSIEEFKRGYIQMYPKLHFAGRISAPMHKTEPQPSHSAVTTGCLFSGGADAFCTLFRHADEHPLLITLRGSDISLNDHVGWQNVSAHVKKTAADLDCQYAFISSNFRRFMNDGATNQLVAESGEQYWHGFHHGIGLLGHAAPLAWAKGLKTIYIASSYTAADVGQTCASDPTIDNYVRFCGARVVHDGYELTRQMKIHSICEFAERTGLHPTLRVCWRSSGGKNCCKCEKCMRTLFEVLAEGKDPHNYGFDYSATKLMMSRLRVLSEYSPVTSKPFWHEIRRLMAEIPANRIPLGARWARKCDFENERNSLNVRLFNKWGGGITPHQAPHKSPCLRYQIKKTRA